MPSSYHRHTSIASDKCALNIQGNHESKYNIWTFLNNAVLIENVPLLQQHTGSFEIPVRYWQVQCDLEQIQNDFSTQKLWGKKILEISKLLQIRTANLKGPKNRIQIHLMVPLLQDAELTVLWSVWEEPDGRSFMLAKFSVSLHLLTSARTHLSHNGHVYHWPG